MCILAWTTRKWRKMDVFIETLAPTGPRNIEALRVRSFSGRQLHPSKFSARCSFVATVLEQTDSTAASHAHVAQ